ncbi:MAG: ketoacyl-ACP synthase III [Prevotellaceae bacterium]|nr:ketoacyl-ACP synthase III [Prevotellaceae bacterium]
MAFLEFKNVRVAGLAAGVPANIVSNLSAEIQVSEGEYSNDDFVKTTGVYERRFSEHHTTSDLCYEAAEQLMADLQWRKDEIDALIFVSQNTDYFLPATACILQDRLGLPKECYAEDIVLGCSGWVYGLSTTAALLQGGYIKKALLMCGDAKRHFPTNDPLFGFAGTITALEYQVGAKSFQFHFGTDGSGYDSIIIPEGGARNPISFDGFKEEEIDGHVYNRFQTRMKGMDVFAFGISTAPKSVKKLAEHFGFDYQTADYFVFHQANMKMNKMIIKKLKLDETKVPSSMYHFGNTSSASIPLTIVTQLKGKIEHQPTKFICCGFGVGLSWGSVSFETDNIIISDLVECK